MATDVIMPALGMAQETGTLIRWLKAEGDAVREGEPIAEIQTDKATVELEARVSGILTGLRAQSGQDVPVGQVIASITQPAEQVPAGGDATPALPTASGNGGGSSSGKSGGDGVLAAAGAVDASPVAIRVAAEHGVDLRALQTNGRRVQKADVLAYLDTRAASASGTETVADQATAAQAAPARTRLTAASPKARRLARERGIDLTALRGTGPHTAVLTRDVLAFASAAEAAGAEVAGAEVAGAEVASPAEVTGAASTLSPIWRIMAERTTRSWQEIPHFFLLREVNASRLIAWREGARRQHDLSLTITDLLVKVVAETLRAHPRVNASWLSGGIVHHTDVNIGVAVAIEDGLVVPVIQRADQLSLAEITARREELVRRAQAGKQRPDDLTGATFTISNLGMYGVDAFSAIVPGPQAAILAVGRIAERVVPLNGAPAVQPVMALSLSCDHRVVDGARAAQFLGALAMLIEEPLALLG